MPSPLARAERDIVTSILLDHYDGWELPYQRAEVLRAWWALRLRGCTIREFVQQWIEDNPPSKDEG